MTRHCPIALASALVAACAAAGGASGKLANSAWHVTSIDGRPAASADAGLAFAGTRLSANAGCNTIAGSWRAKDGRLLAGNLISTEMYCAAPSLMEQERALATLLAGAPAFRIDGDSLELRTGGHSAQFHRQR